MATPKILIKRSNVAGRVPTSLDSGELALNTADGKIYYTGHDGAIHAFMDSAGVNTLINNSVSTLDSGNVTDMIDSNYIQTRQITYTLPTLGNDFVDSAQVQAIINAAYVKNIIDSAYVASIVETDGDITITITNEITSTVDSAYVQSRVDATDFLDSAEALALIDSAYILARADSAYIKTVTGIDADLFDGQNSAFYRNYNNLTSRPTILDNVDVENQIDSDYVRLRQDFRYSSLTGKPNILDSANIVNIINSEGLDSDLVTALVDSAYISLRDRFQDSSLVTSTVDAAYVQARQIKYLDSEAVKAITLDSSEISTVVTSGYVQARQDFAYGSLTGTPTALSDFTNDVITSTSDVSEGSRLYFTNDRVRAISLDSEDATNLIDSAYIQARQTSGTDSAATIALITSTVDSAYVQLRETAGQVLPSLGNDFIDSAEALKLIPKFGTDFVDSGQVELIVDSNYVRLKTRIGDSDIDFGSYKITYSNVYSNVSDLPDASTYHGMFAHVHATGAGYFAHAGNWIRLANQSEIFDGAYGSLTGTPTIPVLGTDFVDSAEALKLIDANALDSGRATSLIDSAYVQLRQDYAYGSLTGTPTIPAFGTDYVDSAFVTGQGYITSSSLPVLGTDFVDSGQVELIVDSAYVQLRQSATGSGLDSNAVIALIDSTYVQAREATSTVDSSLINNVSLSITTFKYTATAGQTVFTGADDNNLSLDYHAGHIRVSVNGILLVDSDDYTATNGSSLTLIDSANVNDVITIEKFRGRDVGLDSTGVTNLIDSAYVQLRQDFAYSSLTGTPTIPTIDTDFVDSARVLRMISNEALDSDLTIALVDSAYIQLRDRFQDSSLVTSTVNQSYVRNLETPNPVLGTDFVDSAQVELIVDSAYVQLRQDFAYGSLTGSPVVFDSEMVDAVIDSHVRNELFQNLNTIGPDKLGVANYGVYIGQFTTNGTASSDQRNTHIGNRAGMDIQNADDNVYVGYNAGGSYGGSNNVALGSDANLLADGSNTVVIGQGADAWPGTISIGQQSQTGDGGLAIGYRAKSAETTIAIGYQTGVTDLDSGNVLIGYQAGQYVSSGLNPGGSRNIAIGNKTLGTVGGSLNGLRSEARNNVVIGHEAGGRLTRGADNIVIGRSNAGSTLNFGSNNIIIGVNAGNAISSWAATNNTIAIGDSGIDRLMIEGLGLDTEKAVGGQFLKWTGTQFQFDSTAAGVSLGTDYIDSAQALILIDANALDSGRATSLIDSAYIELRRPPEAVFGVTNNGAGAYTFNGDGFSSGRDNPDIYLQRGKTYKFEVNASGHPFQIRSSNGGSAYNTGVTNNGAETGNVLFTPDMNAPDVLFYQCTNHGGMVGRIYIFDVNTFVDSAFVTSSLPVLGTDFIDSAQALILIDANALDSARATSLITSSYIQSRQSLIDSALTTSLIDSAYVQARTTGAGAGTDSAATIALIEATVDSAYVQLREAAGGGGSGTLDSALTIDLIDSAYVQARQSTVSGTGLDSAGTIALINDTHLTVTTYVYTADSAGHVAYEGADDNGAVLALSSASKNYRVSLNGILLLDSDDFNATDTKVTLTGSVSASDILTVETFKGRHVAGGINSYRFTPSAGTTTITGADVKGKTLNYTEDQVQVFLNGIALIDSADFTATSGTSIVLDTATAAGDEILIQNFIPSSERIWTETATSVNVGSNTKNIVDCSDGAITVTFPSLPTFGDEIRVIDGTGTSATNNITINRNGNNIQGAADNFILDVNRAAVGFVYYNDSQGWILIEN